MKVSLWRDAVIDFSFIGNKKRATNLLEWHGGLHIGIDMSSWSAVAVWLADIYLRSSIYTIGIAQRCCRDAFCRQACRELYERITAKGKVKNWLWSQCQINC